MAKPVGDAADDQSVEGFHFGTACVAFSSESCGAEESTLRFLLAALLASVVETDDEAVPFGFLRVL